MFELTIALIVILIGCGLGYRFTLGKQTPATFRAYERQQQRLRPELISKRLRVYLDGEDVTRDCFMADDRTGECWLFVFPRQVADNGEIKMTHHTGNVMYRWEDADKVYMNGTKFI